MYIEATYQTDGDNAKLMLYLNGNGEVSCLRFYYHMYGDTIGALNVYSEKSFNIQLYWKSWKPLDKGRKDISFRYNSKSCWKKLSRKTETYFF